MKIRRHKATSEDPSVQQLHRDSLLDMLQSQEPSGEVVQVITNKHNPLSCISAMRIDIGLGERDFVWKLHLNQLNSAIFHSESQFQFFLLIDYSIAD